MGRRLPSLSALRAFEAAGRHLSFSRAATELFVTQSAISRQIRSLEDYLGTLMFRRFNRRLELTEAGATYLATMKDCFDRLEDATVRIRSKPSREQLNISVLPTFAIRWLVPRLPAFTEAHPDIDVRMAMSSEPVDFNRDEVDVAIRVGRADRATDVSGTPDSATRVRLDRLFPDVLVPVCSATHQRESPPLRSPKDLTDHVLLHTTTRRNAWEEWSEAMGVAKVTSVRELWFGHFFMTHQAACEGRGIAVLPLVFVADDLASGRLVEAIERPIASGEWYYMLCRENQARGRNLALFREWIDEESRSAKSEADAIGAAQPPHKKSRN